ncbi:MAG: RNA polymerase sigma factor [Cyclobacteriaceae bacterium]
MTEEEFISLVNTHKGIIGKIIYLYIDNPVEKEDMRQEILLQAWRSSSSFQGKSSFSTWLYRVALNTVLGYHRKKKPDVSTLEKLPEYASDTISEPSDRTELLLFEIKQLNPIDKMVITLHLEDYANDEIAEMSGLTKNNVGVKLHRIKHHLTNRMSSK